MEISQDSASPSPSLDDCLKLLRGERDEQKLAGLLLATKLCQGTDNDSVLKVYNAVGPRFLDRLLMTGMGKGSGGESGDKGGADQEAYLKLAVTVLAAFCRVPEIASSEGMISRVPVVAEIISKSSEPSTYEECYEILFLVAASSDSGSKKFFESGILEMLAPHFSSLADDSRSLEPSMRLLQLVLNKLPLDMMDAEYVTGVSCMVASIARQFGVLHNSLKFDALHLLTSLLSSNNTVLYDALRSIPSENWASYIRVGIEEILQNRVVSAEKLQALLLAESMMAILGESWLLEKSKTHDAQASLSVDKYLMLVLESSRVEVDVLLNELAYLKYEASKSSATAESILMKQRDLAVSFSLIERIIKLISNVCSAEGSPIAESTLEKMIRGLDETIKLVLEFLQDSKDHGQRRGNDLLAAVRIIGSYLAETPFAWKEKTCDLLEYIFSIEGEDESRPLFSICFMLPMLCQTTTEIDACKALAAFNGHKAIVECLVEMIMQDRATVESNGMIFLACETILNFLLKRLELKIQLEESEVVGLLKALTSWSEDSTDPSTVMMSSSICTLLLDLTSESSLLNQFDFKPGTLERLAQLIVRSLSEGEMDDINEKLDLHQIITAGYYRWADRFPLVRNVVGPMLNV